MQLVTSSSFLSKTKFVNKLMTFFIQVLIRMFNGLSSYIEIEMYNTNLSIEESNPSTVFLNSIHWIL